MEFLQGRRPGICRTPRRTPDRLKGFREILGCSLGYTDDMIFYHIPLLRTLLRPLLRTLFHCKTHSKPPSQNPSPALPRTFSEPFFAERCVAVRPLRRAPKFYLMCFFCSPRVLHVSACLLEIVPQRRPPIANHTQARKKDPNLNF